MRILITGKNGYVGRSLHSYLYSKHDITIIGRQDLDLTNPNETSKLIRCTDFSVALCSGYLMKCSCGKAKFSGLLICVFKTAQ